MQQHGKMAAYQLLCRSCGCGENVTSISGVWRRSWQCWHLNVLVAIASEGYVYDRSGVAGKRKRTAACSVCMATFSNVPVMVKRSRKRSSHGAALAWQRLLIVSIGVAWRILNDSVSCG